MRRAPPKTQLKVASYPTLRPAVVQSFGVAALNAASPDGLHVVFHERQTAGLSNLYLAPRRR